MPLYRKAHSRGEFVFDFSWANAYAQHGLRLLPQAADRHSLYAGARPAAAVGPGRARDHAKILIARRWSTPAPSACLSWHMLFPTEDTAPPADRAGLIERRDCQFHWFNQGYDSFEAFLATFTAEKRKKAKRERRRVAEAGIEFDTRMAAT
jgi:predicted N-acyltransferase